MTYIITKHGGGFTGQSIFSGTRDACRAWLAAKRELYAHDKCTGMGDSLRIVSGDKTTDFIYTIKQGGMN